MGGPTLETPRADKSLKYPTVVEIEHSRISLKQGICEDWRAVGGLTGGLGAILGKPRSDVRASLMIVGAWMVGAGIGSIVGDGVCQFIGRASNFNPNPDGSLKVGKVLSYERQHRGDGNGPIINQRIVIEMEDSKWRFELSGTGGKLDSLEVGERIAIKIVKAASSFRNTPLVAAR